MPSFKFLSETKPMKTIKFAGALAAALATLSVANAADVAAPTAYHWTGFYAGVNAGVAWNNTNIDQSQFDDGKRIKELEDNLTSNQTVFTGGGMLGYNWQVDQIVLGVEADINYLGFSDNKDFDRDIASPFGPIDATSSLSFDANWFGTIRGRLGFAHDNILFYGTGGLAYGHMETEANLNISQYGQSRMDYEGSNSSTNWGWTVGGGIEYGLDRWSIGAEYLYVDLGSAEWDGDFSGPASKYMKADAEGSVDYQFSVVRATAKLRF